MAMGFTESSGLYEDDDRALLQPAGGIVVGRWPNDYGSSGSTSPVPPSPIAGQAKRKKVQLKRYVAYCVCVHVGIYLAAKLENARVERSVSVRWYHT